MGYLRIFFAAMIFIMPAATLYAATAVKQPQTAGPYRDFAGIISLIDDRQVIISNIPFALKPEVVPNFRDFAPGDHVLVHLYSLNGTETVAAMFHLAFPNGGGAQRTAPPGPPPAAQPVATPAPKGQAAAPASQGSVNPVKPSGSAPVKQQNGVWTN